MGQHVNRSISFHVMSWQLEATGRPPACLAGPRATPAGEQGVCNQALHVSCSCCTGFSVNATANRYPLACMHHNPCPIPQPARLRRHRLSSPVPSPSRTRSRTRCRARSASRPPAVRRGTVRYGAAADVHTVGARSSRPLAITDCNACEAAQGLPTPPSARHAPQHALARAGWTHTRPNSASTRPDV